MKQISQELNTSLESSGYDHDCTASRSEVLAAIGKLKLGKSYGYELYIFEVLQPV